MFVKSYTPQKLVSSSRYQNYFPTLPADVQRDVYARMAKILGSRGLIRLGAMCCHADVINYGALPYTDFIRTQTLCQGGEICDFLFVRHDTDAGVGWERSASI